MKRRLISGLVAASLLLATACEQRTGGDVPPPLSATSADSATVTTAASPPSSLELPDNICAKLVAILATAAADDLIEVNVWANLPDEPWNRGSFVLAFIEEHSSVFEAEWEAFAEEFQAVWPDEVFSAEVWAAERARMAHRFTVRKIVTDWNNEFIATHVHPDRKILYFSNFTTTFIIEATPAEILYLAGLDEVSDLSFYEEQFPTPG
jgi:hypothetical protein